MPTTREYELWKGLEIDAWEHRDEKKPALTIFREWQALKPKAIQQEIAELIDAFRVGQRAVENGLTNGDVTALALEHDVGAVNHALGALDSLRTKRKELSHSQIVIEWLDSREKAWHTTLADLERRLEEAQKAAGPSAAGEESTSYKVKQPDDGQAVPEQKQVDQDQTLQSEPRTRSGGGEGTLSYLPAVDHQRDLNASASMMEVPAPEDVVPSIEPSDHQPGIDIQGDADNGKAVSQQQPMQGPVHRADSQQSAQHDPGAASDQDPESPGAVVLSEKAISKRVLQLAQTSNRSFEFCLGLPPRSQGWVVNDLGKLGEGGWGTVTLFVRQNEFGMIVDRVAVKDTRQPGSSFPELWHDDTDKPTEVVAMQRLRPLRGSENTVIIRNWLKNDDLRGTRIFMEYCPHGNLWDLMHKYRYHQPFETLPRGIRGLWIPEPFLWYLFESLAIAGVLMEKGDLVPNSSNNWDVIVHRDLKCPNIMLGVNTSDTYKAYSQPKLGDFGSCMIISGREVYEYWEIARSGYSHIPPEEHNPYLEGYERPPLVMTSKANVWGVGDVMWSVLSGSDGDLDLEDDNWFNTPKKFKDFPAKVKDHYSPELLDLIMSCLEYIPRKRPTFDDILATIRRHTGGDEMVDHARGLRHAPVNDPKWLRHGLHMSREKFALGGLLDEQMDEKAPEPPASEFDLLEASVLNPDFEGATMVFSRDWNMSRTSSVDDSSQDEDEGSGQNDEDENENAIGNDEDKNESDDPLDYNTNNEQTPRHNPNRKRKHHNISLQSASSSSSKRLRTSDPPSFNAQGDGEMD